MEAQYIHYHLQIKQHNLLIALFKINILLINNIGNFITIYVCICFAQNNNNNKSKKYLSVG